MTISTQLSEKDFIKASFTILFSKASGKILLFIFLMFILSLFISLTSGTIHFSDIFTLIIILIIFPLIIFFSVKRNYNTNQRIKELITYRFEKEFLNIKGESFSSELTWSKFFKVTKTKQYLFIWQNKQIANVIPRHDISDMQIAELKEILNEQGVKNNL